MSDHASVIRVTEFRTQPGKRDDLVQALRPAADRYRDAQGCFGCQVCRVAEDENLVTVVSRWESREALGHAAESGDREAVLAQVRALLAGEPASRHYSPV